MTKMLESKRDAEGLELRPVYAIARGDLDDKTEPDGWAHNARQAARIINRRLSEDGQMDTVKGSELFYSRTLQAWFVEE